MQSICPKPFEFQKITWNLHGSFSSLGSTSKSHDQQINEKESFYIFDDVNRKDAETFNIFEGLSFQLFVGGKLDEYTQTAITNTLTEGFNYLRIKAEFYGVVS